MRERMIPRYGTAPRRARKPSQAAKRCFKWARPILPILLFGGVCTLVGVFLAQQPPRLYQYTIDNIIGEGRIHDIGWMILLYVGILVAGQGIDALSRYWMSRGGQSLLHGLRMELYDHLQRLPLAFFDEHRVGDLMTRITGDVRQVESLILRSTNSLVRQVFGMAFALYYMFRFSTLLTLLILIPVPLLVVGVFWVSRRMRTLYRRIRASSGLLGAKLQENLSGIRVIQAFHAESFEHDRVGAVSKRVCDETVRATAASAFFYPLLHLIAASGSVAVLGGGAWLILEERMTIGSLTAFSMYIAYFYRPIQEFVGTFDSVQRTLAAGERIFEILDTDPAIQDPRNPLEMPPARGAVVFDDVSFAYVPDMPVLQKISFHVQPGSVLALVGHSGVGKTSIVNLIGRFYDVSKGRILIDGVDIREVRLSDLRERLAYVLQDTFLFDGTIAENIQYGKPDADREAVIAAARAAYAHAFIVDLPDGYETKIGERGVKLSGGQKQRIAIARALLKNPAILILDEATSAVDGESEILIHQALERLMQGRTTLIIAHRLSTVCGADHILVLDQGRVVEQGNHESLMQQQGLYASMIALQRDGFIV